MSFPTQVHTYRFALPASAAGQRLDQALAVALPQYSRARLQQWIRAGAVQMAGKAARRPRDRVQGGEQVHIEARLEADERLVAERLALDVIIRTSSCWC